MVGVFVDDGLEFPVAQVLFGIVAQVQNDVGAAFVLGDGLHLKVAAAAAGPAHTFSRRRTSTAGFHHDLVGHDKARVKAHAKLPNERALVFGVSLLVATEFAHEVAGAAFGNRAQMVYSLLLAHANAVVADGQGLGGFVKSHADLQRGHVFKQSSVVQRFIAQLVASV